MVETEQGVVGIRSLTGGWRTLVRVQLIAIPIIGTFFILDIPFYLGMAILIEQYFGIFFALLSGSLFLLFPADRKSTGNRVPSMADRIESRTKQRPRS